MSRESELMRSLEELNIQSQQIINSSEYKIGKKIIELKNNKIKLKTFLKTLIMKKNHKKVNENYIDFINKSNWTNEEYLSMLISDLRNKKVVIYTCITGGYDKLLDPIFIDCNFDYVVFSDKNIESKVWFRKPIPSELKKLNDNILINRYFKMHPYEFFREYDYAIYIDGNVQIISDISSMLKMADNKTGLAMHRHVNRNCIYKEAQVCILYEKGNKEKLKSQILKYKKNFFPENYGMLEATMIISDLHNNQGKEILDDWWQEYLLSQSLRDQISLPYILWKKNLKVTDIGFLGRNIYRNPKIYIRIHK